MVRFVFPAHSFRRLPTPLDPQGIQAFHCVVPVAGIPDGFRDWMDVNAREPSLAGRVPKAIRQTLTEAPQYFVAFNRGLALLADQVDWDNQAGQVTATFKDKARHGVFDGGHTLANILDHRASRASEDSNGDPEAHCRVEIWTGVPPELITDLVEARNTSRQVASKSLLNLDGQFQSLKGALGLDLVSLISWRENEDAPIDVREVVALLTALDKTHYDADKHPMVAYSGKEACLRHFENNPECYKKVYPVARDILEVWEEIQVVIPEQYNAQGGRFGRLKGCEPLTRARELPIMKASTEYTFPNAYLYPILAAFRSMLVEDGGAYKWGKGVTPSQLVAQGLATRIFSGPVVNSIREYHSPNRTGKDANVWALAYQIAENSYLRLP